MTTTVNDDEEDGVILSKNAKNKMGLEEDEEQQKPPQKEDVDKKMEATNNSGEDGGTTSSSCWGSRRSILLFLLLAALALGLVVGLVVWLVVVDDSSDNGSYNQATNSSHNTEKDDNPKQTATITWMERLDYQASLIRPHSSSAQYNRNEEESPTDAFFHVSLYSHWPSSSNNNSSATPVLYSLLLERIAEAVVVSSSPSETTETATTKTTAAQGQEEEESGDDDWLLCLTNNLYVLLMEDSNNIMDPSSNGIRQRSSFDEAYQQVCVWSSTTTRTTAETPNYPPNNNKAGVAVQSYQTRFSHHTIWLQLSDGNNGGGWDAYGALAVFQQPANVNNHAHPRQQQLLGSVIYNRLAQVSLRPTFRSTWNSSTDDYDIRGKLWARGQVRLHNNNNDGPYVTDNYVLAMEDLSMVPLSPALFLYLTNRTRWWRLNQETDWYVPMSYESADFPPETVHAEGSYRIPWGHSDADVDIAEVAASGGFWYLYCTTFTVTLAYAELELVED